jgi:hypothetical protein
MKQHIRVALGAAAIAMSLASTAAPAASANCWSQAAGRGAIVAANDRLKAHFMTAGPVAGQRDYDRYTTALANAYGAAETGPESCAEASSLAADAARGDVNSLAAQAVPVATLPAAACPADNSVVLAAK